MYTVYLSPKYHGTPRTAFQKDDAALFWPAAMRGAMFFTGGQSLSLHCTAVQTAGDKTVQKQMQFEECGCGANPAWPFPLASKRAASHKAIKPTHTLGHKLSICNAKPHIPSSKPSTLYPYTQEQPPNSEP